MRAFYHLEVAVPRARPGRTPGPPYGWRMSFVEEPASTLGSSPRACFAGTCARHRAASAGPARAMCCLASRTVCSPRMEDRGGEHGRGGMAVADARDQVIEVADAAGGNHRHRHRVGDGARQRDVKTPPGAVAVHRGQQNLAGAERNDFPRISDGIDAGRVAAAMGEDFPAVEARPADDTFLASIATTMHWSPNFLRRLLDEVAVVHGLAVLIDTLVGAGDAAAPGCPRSCAHRRPRSTA